MPIENTIPFEVDLQSTDVARPNEALLQEILTHQNELAEALSAEFGPVQQMKIEPQAAFPTGLEIFVISVTVAFATGVAEGVAHGAGKEVGKVIGQEIGRRVGERIRKWIEDRFGDVDVKRVIEK
jgi:hypothetical protein